MQDGDAAQRWVGAPWCSCHPLHPYFGADLQEEGEIGDGEGSPVGFRIGPMQRKLPSERDAFRESHFPLQEENLTFSRLEKYDLIVPRHPRAKEEPQIY